MADPMKIRAQIKGDVAEIRILMGHAMETGQRKDAAGATVPAHFIQSMTVDVAGKPITSGARARAFASYMRIHTLEATGNLTYSQLGRYTAKPGAPAKLTDGHGGTNDAQYAQLDPKTQRPIENASRNLWITETALTTALNTSYMAEQIALFGLVVGVALLLAGIGFAILAIGGALHNLDAALASIKKPKKTGQVETLPTA